MKYNTITHLTDVGFTDLAIDIELGNINKK